MWAEPSGDQLTRVAAWGDGVSNLRPTTPWHAAFHRDYHDVFASWMERLAGDLLSPAAVRADRFRLLQWALCGLVQRLDEEGTYVGGWIERSVEEIRKPEAYKPVSNSEEQLREHLAALES